MVLAQSLVNDVSDIGVVRLLGKTGKWYRPPPKGGTADELPIGGYDLDRGPICCLWKGTSEKLPFEGNSRAVGCEASPVFARVGASLSLDLIFVVKKCSEFSHEKS